MKVFTTLILKIEKQSIDVLSNFYNMFIYDVNVKKIDADACDELKLNKMKWIKSNVYNYFAEHLCGILYSSGEM